MPILQSALSASAIGTYVFDRGATTIFSLSASLASPGNTTKAYATALGPLWRGTGTGGPGGDDVNNLQYNNSAPWTYDEWVSYYKGFLLTRSARHGDPNGACGDTTEDSSIYVTDAEFWNSAAGAGVVNNATQGYTNTSGTTVFAGNDEYYKIFELNTAYTIDNNGIFSNEFGC